MKYIRMTTLAPVAMLLSIIPAAIAQEDAPSDGDSFLRSALERIAPLSPEQIREVRRELDRIEHAKDSPLAEMKSSSRSMSVSMKSGEAPVRVDVHPGWLTALTFSDRTGQPWPVGSVSVGNPDAYDFQSTGSPGTSNIVTISALRAHVPSNLSVLLADARVPLLFALNPSAESIDYRIDIIVDRRGPNAANGTVSNSTLPPANDSTILAFLDGIAPDGAVPLKPSPERELQVWRMDERIYVRTSLDLLSPAYSAKHSNSSGVKVFVLDEAPVLLVSDEGRMSFINVNQ